MLVLFSGQSNCFADVLDLAECDFVNFALVPRSEEVGYGPELVASYIGMCDGAVPQACIEQERVDRDKVWWTDSHRGLSFNFGSCGEAGVKRCCGDR